MASILLVDDDDEVRDVLCEAIRSGGHQSDCIGSCAEGLRLIASSTHHLIIADVNLRDGSGYDLAEAALATGKRALLITGHSHAPRRLRAGPVRHLRKPFQIDEFLHAINQELGSP